MKLSGEAGERHANRKELWIGCFPSSFASPQTGLFSELEALLSLVAVALCGER